MKEKFVVVDYDRENLPNEECKNLIEGTTSTTNQCGVSLPIKILRRDCQSQRETK